MLTRQQQNYIYVILIYHYNKQMKLWMLTFISSNFRIWFGVSNFPIITAWGHYKVNEENRKRDRDSQDNSPLKEERKLHLASFQPMRKNRERLSINGQFLYFYPKLQIYHDAYGHQTSGLVWCLTQQSSVPKYVVWEKKVKQGSLKLLGKWKPQASFPVTSSVVNRLLKLTLFKYYNYDFNTLRISA